MGSIPCIPDAHYSAGYKMLAIQFTWLHRFDYNTKTVAGLAASQFSPRILREALPKTVLLVARKKKAGWEGNPLLWIPGLWRFQSLSRSCLPGFWFCWSEGSVCRLRCCSIQSERGNVFCLFRATERWLYTLRLLSSVPYVAPSPSPSPLSSSGSFFLFFLFSFSLHPSSVHLPQCGKKTRRGLWLPRPKSVSFCSKRCRFLWSQQKRSLTSISAELGLFDCWGKTRSVRPSGWPSWSYRSPAALCVFFPTELWA